MNYATTLDLREIAEEWRNAIDEAQGEDFDDSHFIALSAELGVEGELEGLEYFASHYEPVMILQSTFAEYASELADDLGLVPEDASWPLTCIDWIQAARELAYDYTSITYDGQEYYIRST